MKARVGAVGYRSMLIPEKDINNKNHFTDEETTYKLSHHITLGLPLDIVFMVCCLLILSVFVKLPGGVLSVT